MCIKPLYLLQNLDKLGLDDEEDAVGVVLQHYDYYLRLMRAKWLKTKFGELKIPRDLFVVVVDADITPDVLNRWYKRGGINCVYYLCKVIFGGGAHVDSAGIRAVQEEIARCRERIGGS